MLRCALFIGVFLLIWISLEPFHNLGDATTIDVASGRGPTYAVFALLAMLSLALVVRRHAEALRSFLTTPYILFGCWMCINLLMSRDPGASMVRFSLTASVFVVAATVLLLPETARELNAWLGVAVLTFLAVCYLGVLVTPELCHPPGHGCRGVSSGRRLARRFRAQELGVRRHGDADLYRHLSDTIGRHGGRAAHHRPCRPSSCFSPAARARPDFASSRLCIVELVVAVRSFRLRALLCFVPLIVLNLLGIGTVVSPSLHAISGLLPFDTSFTGRDEVWGFAFDSIAQRPILGWGYLAFWGSSFLRDVDPGGAINDWVVIASHSHNAYLDSALALGIPGLLLLIVILVVAPLRNYHRAAERGGATPLANMFLRIWLFGIYLASLESFFLERTDPIWFTFLVAVIGLHYLSRFRTTA